MKDLFVLMVALIGVALALFLVLNALLPSSGVSPDGEREAEAWVPREIEGFRLESVSRAEAAFSSERFSVHARFLPTSDSRFARGVESLGISVFYLERAEAAGEIEDLLLLTESRPLTFRGVEMAFFASEEARLVGLVWQEGLTLYHVRVSGKTDAFDPDLLREAALAAAGALLEGGER